MTETNMNTSNPYDGERVAGTVGFPLPGVELRIADPDSGAALPQGEIGMIEVHGPNVFKGYWRMPEKTGAEFRADGFFITGDLGQIDEHGYVHIVGRAKDLIITGGFNVYPKEVESEIDALPGVVETAVIGCRIRISAKASPPSWCCSKARTPTRRRSSPLSKAGLPTSSCRSACSSSTICRATPWARCRRTCCASRTPSSMPDLR